MCKDCQEWRDKLVIENARHLTEQERDRGLIIGLLATMNERAGRIYVPYYAAIAATTGGTAFQLIPANNLQRQTYRQMYITNAGAAAALVTLTITGEAMGVAGQVIAAVRLAQNQTTPLPDFDLPSGCTLSITSDVNTTAALYVYGQTYMQPNTVREANHGRKF